MNSQPPAVHGMLLAALAVSCGPAPEHEPEFLAITGATIVDGTGAAPFQRGVIVLSEDRIVAVGPSGSTAVPENAATVRADGKWIIPGMIDLHVHFWESGRPGAQPTFVANLTPVFPYEDEVAWMKRRIEYTLSRYICSGVTSVVALGAIPWEYEVRRLAESVVAPRVFLAGGFIGNYPHTENAPVWEDTQPGYWIEDAATARALVATLDSTGIDMIKAGFVPHPDYPLEGFRPALAALVESSHERGLPVSVHANELRSARAAIEAGADVLAHTVSDSPVDEDFIRLALGSGVVNTSSAGVFTGHARLLLDEFTLDDVERRCGDPQVTDAWDRWSRLPQAERPELPEFLRSAWHREQQIVENLNAMNSAGVPVAVGSDGGNIGSLHGPSFHKELRLLAGAGLSPMEVLVAATRNGAGALGRSADLGTLEPGKLADLVILDANPLASVENLSRVASVIVRGEFLGPEDWNGERRNPGGAF